MAGNGFFTESTIALGLDAAQIGSDTICPSFDF
jgi:hypothetical protein